MINEADRSHAHSAAFSIRWSWPPSVMRVIALLQNNINSIKLLKLQTLLQSKTTYVARKVDPAQFWSFR